MSMSKDLTVRMEQSRFPTESSNRRKLLVRAKCCAFFNGKWTLGRA